MYQFVIVQFISGKKNLRIYAGRCNQEKIS
ncbi:hypothetical protein V462_19210 [Pantoea ananatis 15320]|nr:hypothetical protein L585_04570 [Pantoea ananatis BRT175]PKC30676.1 hypothetical protein V462_19210 [Pantoea ananatis 15320]PKC41965.1 hypothetical protein V461_16640 [Pantoea ananatis BRT98]